MKGARRALLISAVTTAVLYWIPYGRWVLYPLLLLSTLAHETGHGLAALVAGGSFQRLSLWADGSGVAEWSAAGTSRLMVAWVAAGGLLGPALAAAAGFLAGRRVGAARSALVLASVSTSLLLLLFVRNSFGVVYLVLVVAMLVGVRARSSGIVAQWTVLFLSLQLALSVFSRADYLFTPVAQTSAGAMPSDVELIAQALWLPYWFWGALVGALSVAIVVAGLRSVWR